MIAARLKAQSGSELPGLWVFTDPVRYPDPLLALQGLGEGAALVYRHFGKDDRLDEALALRALTQARGVQLWIGNDPALAEAVGADGVHWPERVWRAHRLSAPRPLNASGALHVSSRHAVSAPPAVDAVMVSTVFASRSASAGRPLGPAGLARIAQSLPCPVIGLGGIHARNAGRLLSTGAAGLAVVDGWFNTGA